MFRTLRKAAESIEKTIDVALSAGTDQEEGCIIHVNGTSLRLGKVFAEGGFSFVHSAEPVSGPAHVVYAVKRIAVADNEALARARKEAELLASLPPHPNIVRYFASSFSPPDAFLVFEMVDGGSLAERLNRRTSPASSEEALNILDNIIAAVCHLHAQVPEPIACRDIKLENLLYDRLQKCYKLCDFGSCTTVAKVYNSRREILDAEDEIKEHCSAPYRSPELVDLYAKQFVCEKTDVWSVGCVWFAVLYGKLPFDGQSTLPILQGRFTIPESPVYPESFQKLLSAMLMVTVAQRADAFAIYEAVCRLRGCSMSPSIWQAGVALRQRRQQASHTRRQSSCRDISESSLVLGGIAATAAGGGLVDSLPTFGHKSENPSKKAQATLCGSQGETTVGSQPSSDFLSEHQTKTRSASVCSTEGHANDFDGEEWAFIVERHRGTDIIETSSVSNAEAAVLRGTMNRPTQSLQSQRTFGVRDDRSGGGPQPPPCQQDVSIPAVGDLIAFSSENDNGFENPKVSALSANVAANEDWADFESAFSHHVKIEDRSTSSFLANGGVGTPGQALLGSECSRPPTVEVVTRGLMNLKSPQVASTVQRARTLAPSGSDATDRNKASSQRSASSAVDTLFAELLPSDFGR